MKNFFTTLAVATAFFVNAQVTLTKDSAFGTNGIVRMPLQGTAEDLHIMQSQDNKLLGWGYENSFDGSDTVKRMYKYNLDGSPDISFGTNGSVTLPNYASYYNLVLQGSDKILVYYQFGRGSSDSVHILRYNINGTIDPSFGTNGEFIQPRREGATAAGFEYNQLVVLNDNSLFFAYGSDMVKLTPDGQYDLSYGTNGIATTNENMFDIRLVGNDILSENSQKLQKKDLNGNLISSFATNGTYTFPASDDYIMKLKPNGNIQFLGLGSASFYNINSSGALINSVTLPTDSEYHDVTSQGTYTVFSGITPSSANPILLFLDQNNNIQTVNGLDSYHEPIRGVYNSVLSSGNNLYVSGFEEVGGTYNFILAKYINTTASLATTDIKIQNGVVFENPVRSALNFRSAEKITKVELYSMDGRLMRSISASGANVGDLQRGVYIAKIYFQNGKNSSTKIIKQ